MPGVRMTIVRLASLPFVLIALVAGAAPVDAAWRQAPTAQSPPAVPTTPATGGQPKPAAAPRRAPRTAVRPTLVVEVTDPAGGAVAGVAVEASGAVERSGRTGLDGIVSFTGLRTGPYRLRFERDGFVLLERDVTLATRQVTIDVVLTPAPAPLPTPVAAAVPATPVEVARPVGQSVALEVPAFIEQNFVGREPQKTSVVGCSGYATSRIVQIREPLRDERREDADETLYVVAGEGELKMAGREGVIEAGTLVVVPRGTTWSLSRRGRSPVVLLSVVSGPPCPDAK
jgi:hypothetical protein